MWFWETTENEPEKNIQNQRLKVCIGREPVLSSFQGERVTAKFKRTP